jgi:hypothetical protein
LSRLLPGAILTVLLEGLNVIFGIIINLSGL